ncbi:MarR family winged helix-turn-helix transcriptional regulator [Nodosilinea sp. PGN35]|uniref:MarR family winged helix-turn-helix transcriptional regulator n=1 Tax=Nodosilinea sp. PGN35 TaxID=3020489 RepID=UPI0023B29609|nr:MarR family winged helix-turn-helix transcriptional regulator [Nodosilinea sp. TSF1-S3]MDF0365525.1 MarR family winged helix-turn-helix transcriptional regulator [Nodosilinea sp. TSF1-S3]
MEHSSDASQVAPPDDGVGGRSGSHSSAVEPPLNWEPLPDCLGHWTGFVLHWVNELGAQYYARAMAPLGLRPLQVGILQVLAGEGPTRQARLGDKLRVDKATMVALLNDLEAQGLVERRPHPSDRRAYDIHLLAAGCDRLRAAEQASIAAASEFFAALTPAEQHTFNQLLRRIATSPL